jgi:hypothetical protein
MTDKEWRGSNSYALGLQLCNHGTNLLLILSNGGAAPVRFALPGGNWVRVLESAGNGEASGSATSCVVPAYALTVLEPASTAGS